MTREWPWHSTVQPGVMKRAPASAMEERASAEVSANWLPRSMRRAFVIRKSSFSMADVRVV